MYFSFFFFARLLKSMTEMVFFRARFSEILFPKCFSFSHPVKEIKQSALGEMRCPRVGVEMFCTEPFPVLQCCLVSRSNTNALMKCFIKIVKSCSAELVWIISRLVCSKLAWVLCRPTIGKRKPCWPGPLVVQEKMPPYRNKCGSMARDQSSKLLSPGLLN